MMGKRTPFRHELASPKNGGKGVRELQEKGSLPDGLCDEDDCMIKTDKAKQNLRGEWRSDEKKMGSLLDDSVANNNNFVNGLWR